MSETPVTQRLWLVFPDTPIIASIDFTIPASLFSPQSLAAYHGLDGAKTTLSFNCFIQNQSFWNATDSNLLKYTKMAPQDMEPQEQLYFRPEFDLNHCFYFSYHFLCIHSEEDHDEEQSGKA